MINSESLLHSKSSHAVEAFRNAVTDLLLEASASKSIENYSINTQVVKKFDTLVKNAKTLSTDIFNEYSTPYKLLLEVKVLGQTLDAADISDLLTTDAKRDAIISGLEKFYNSLKQLTATSGPGNSSLFLVG